MEVLFHLKLAYGVIQINYPSLSVISTPGWARELNSTMLYKKGHGIEEGYPGIRSTHSFNYATGYYRFGSFAFVQLVLR